MTALANVWNHLEKASDPITLPRPLNLFDSFRLMKQYMSFLDNVRKKLISSYEKTLQDLQMSGVAKMARRYFVMNAFDGALTMFGVIIGSYFAGLKIPSVITGAGIGACMAMGISGFVGTFMTERAERIRRIKEIEKAMLTDLGGTEFMERSLLASLFAAFVDGLSPMIAALGPLIPFYLYSFLPFSIDAVFMLAATINISILFGLGAFLGKSSHENIIVCGLIMTGAGFLIVLLLLLLQV